jgi:hypothetical protein
MPPTRRRVRQLRLECSAFSVECRLIRMNRRWLASADTANGPSLGCGLTAFEALWRALAPFDGVDAVIDELLASLPEELAGGLT